MAYRKTERELDRLCQRRERVVTSACELVQRAGFAGAKAREIAEVAGVSVGSLYSNFNGIVELHAEVFRRLAERELRRIATEVDAAESPSDGLAVLVRGFGIRSLSAPRLAWALLLEPVSPDVETLRLKYRRDYVNLVAGIVREGMEVGEFSSHPDYVSINTFWPLAADRTVWTHEMLYRAEDFVGSAGQSALQKRFRFTNDDVFDQEDFAIAEDVQRSLKHGGSDHHVLGLAEGLLAIFQHNIDARLGEPAVGVTGHRA